MLDDFKLLQIVDYKRIFGKISLRYSFLAVGLLFNEGLFAQRPNILIIMTDQQSADAMSNVVGNKYLDTPNMDYLAERGISFTKAYCPNPLSMPSRSSIFTGRYSHEIGIQDNKFGARVDPEKVPCMGHIFFENGYSTGYVGKWHLPYDSNNKEAHGFQYMRHIKNSGVDSLIAASVVEFIKSESNKPFLAVASFCNPHNICEWARGDKLPDGDVGRPISLNDCPPLLPNHNPTYNESDINRDMRVSIQANPQFPVSDFDEAKWRKYRWAYYRMIEKVDREIGKIINGLKESGKEENTLIIFLSDHGDMQGAHKWNQKTVFYEESSRIPLIICPPGHKTQEQSDILLQTGVDILPSICAFSGIKPPAALPGNNIFDMLKKKKSPDYIVVSNKLSQGKNIFENRENFTPEGRMVRSEKYKYWIYDEGDQRESLFDMENDPGEMNDLAINPAYRKEMDKHRRYLKKWAKKYKDPYLENNKSENILILN